MTEHPKVGGSANKFQIFKFVVAEEEDLLGGCKAFMLPEDDEEEVAFF